MTPPRRTAAAKPIQRSLLVLLEPNAEAEEYLNFFYRHFRQKVTVNLRTVDATPTRLVEQAVAIKRAEGKMERRKQGWAHDETWCLIDADRETDLEPVISLAMNNGVELAISVPCIEFWFLLHFSSPTSSVDRRNAELLLRAALGEEPRLSEATLERMMGNFDTAKARARRLSSDDTGASLNQNHSGSNVWRLVDSITTSVNPRC